MKRQKAGIYKRFLMIAALLGAVFWLISGLFTDHLKHKGMPEVNYSEFLHRVEAGSVKMVRLYADGFLEAQDVAGKAFVSRAPFYYPGLVDELRSRNVIIRVEAPSNNAWSSIILPWIPFVLIIVVWGLVSRRKMGGMSMPFKFGESRARLQDRKACTVTYKDVAGVEEAKEDLREVVFYLQDPVRLQRLGGKVPRGMLLVGPPGTGKTLLARAVAGEAGVPFYTLSGSDFVEMFVGVGASRVRSLFEKARKTAPCIVFIDEIDAVGRHRGAGLGGGHDEREQTLNQLLVEMDGFRPQDSVVLIAATNRPDVLDPALLRPGRFDRQVVVPNPDIAGREAILKVHAKDIRLSKDVDLRIIARGTPGFSGADLANLLNEAALLAARRELDVVGRQEIDDARDRILMGPERKSVVINEEDRRVTACHEAGHALVALLLPGTDPVHKVTIVPRGRTLGTTQLLPDKETQNYSRKLIQGRLTVLLAGRAAEEIVFKDVTTGSGNDLETATALARKFVCQWGMSEKLGPVSLIGPEDQVFLGRDLSRRKDYSETTAVAIDEEVQRILKEAYAKATDFINENKAILSRISDALLETEVLDREQLERLVQGSVPLEIEV